MNLVSAFEEVCGRQPEKIALYWGDQEFSYSRLQTSCRMAAIELAKLGVKQGDCVGLWLKNRPEFVPAFFGILEAGAVVVPINNFLKPSEVNFILQDASIDVLITDDELAVHLEALRPARPNLKLFPAGKLSAQLPSTEHPPANTSIAEADLAVLIYTSGTTGRPKGAMLSHGNLLHNVESCRIVLRTVSADRFAVLLPMFHSYMLTVGMLLPLLVGGSMVVVKSLHPVKNALTEVF